MIHIQSIARGLLTELNWRRYARTILRVESTALKHEAPKQVALLVGWFFADDPCRQISVFYNATRRGSSDKWREAERETAKILLKPTNSEIHNFPHNLPSKN